MTKPAADSVAEAVRLSHCGDDSGHKCIGECTITPKGIYLKCVRCGDAQHTIIDRTGYEKLSRILEHVNINLAFIDIYYIEQMLEELNRK